MNQIDVAAITAVKRSDTAELRRRFDAIMNFLNDGYNHKQICEHLNTEGIAIQYPQYRAIMTRLRREKSASSSKVGKPVHAVTQTSTPFKLHRAGVSIPVSSDDDVRVMQEKKLSWNPGSEVKWK